MTVPVSPTPQLTSACPRSADVRQPCRAESRRQPTPLPHFPHTSRHQRDPRLGTRTRPWARARVAATSGDNSGDTVKPQTEPGTVGARADREGDQRTRGNRGEVAATFARGRCSSPRARRRQHRALTALCYPPDRPDCQLSALIERETGLYPGGSSSVGRAAAFQAACRGFDPRLPLHSPHSGRSSESLAAEPVATGTTRRHAP